MYENFDIENIVTPIKTIEFRKLLEDTGYDKAKTEWIIKVFEEGFELGYKGRTENIQQNSPNLALRVGDEIDLWNKVMKEVKLKRYAGPFNTIPFKNYTQSPIGLVPKDGGRNTRLIFHLSYPRIPKIDTILSVNACMPREKCSVKYPDFKKAILRCIAEDCNNVAIAKSVLKSVFHFVPIKIKDFAWLVMKARSPVDSQWYYFVDKCCHLVVRLAVHIFKKFQMHWLTFKRLNQERK